MWLSRIFLVLVLFPLLNLFAASEDCYEANPELTDSSYVYTFYDHIVVSSAVEKSRCVLLKNVPYSGYFRLEVNVGYTASDEEDQKKEEYRLVIVTPDGLVTGELIEDKHNGPLESGEEYKRIWNKHGDVYWENGPQVHFLQRGDNEIYFIKGGQVNRSNSVDFFAVQLFTPPFIVQEPPFTANYSNTIHWMGIDDGAVSQDVYYFDVTADQASGSTQQSLYKAPQTAQPLRSTIFSNLEHGRTYGYFVEAYTDDGDIIRSDTTVSTQDAMPPDQVDIALMRSSWNRKVELFWNAVQDDVSGVKAYHVVRSEDNDMETVYVVLDTIPADQVCLENSTYDYCYTDLIDDPDAMEKEYRYRIDAVDLVDNKSTGIESKLVVGVPTPTISFLPEAVADSFYNGAHITLKADVSSLLQPALHKIKFQAARDNVQFLDGQYGKDRHFFESQWLQLDDDQAAILNTIDLSVGDEANLQFIDGHVYYFRAQLLDTLGNRSAWSDTMFVIPDCFAPDDVTSLDLKAVTNEENTEGWMELAWAGAVDHTSGIDSFIVYRKIEGVDSTFQFLAHAEKSPYFDAFDAINYNGDVTYCVGSFDRVGNIRDFENTEFKATARSQSSPIASFVPIEDKDSLAADGTLITSSADVWISINASSVFDTTSQKLMIKVNNDEKELVLNPSLPNLYLVNIGGGSDSSRIQLRMLYSDKSSSLWSKPLLAVKKSSQSGKKAPPFNEGEELQVHNFPNPFNMSTSINFVLNNESHVLVQVYNIQGRKIRTLLNEHKNQGRHSAHWNGENSEGRVVSSGIYYYVLQIEDNSGHRVNKTQKMLLVK